MTLQAKKEIKGFVLGRLIYDLTCVNLLED